MCIRDRDITVQTKDTDVKNSGDSKITVTDKNGKDSTVSGGSSSTTGSSSSSGGSSSGGGGGSSHSHSYADAWSYDDTYHWHAATCGHNVVSGKAEHTYGEDHKCTVCGSADPAQAVASINGKNYLTLQEAVAVGGEVKLLKDVDISETVIVAKAVKLDLNGKTIGNTNDLWEKRADDWSLLSVRAGGDLTITGNGTLKAKENDCYAVDVQDGATLTIENGTFVGNIHAVYVYQGELTVKGGAYSIQQKYPDAAKADEFVLNCYDEHRTEGTPYPLLSGSGTATAEIAYTQDTPGDVRLRLIVTDRYGFSMERELTTVYKNPELTLTYTQQGNELTVYDRAYIDYTVSQPGYTGNYTVTIVGVPSVFYGRYGSDVPLTTYTQYGNGSNTLRVKPNMVGPNPLKITVTDTDGHSAEIITSVMGVTTTADLKPTFSTASGLLYVTVESSRPVIDDLTVRVTANADIYSYGGTVTKKQYIVSVNIEADRTTGKGSVSLGGIGTYATFSVTSYTAEFKRTSDNGLVEYKLQ